MVYYKTNYKTLEEAVRDSNLPISQIFHTTERKGHVIIFYERDGMLSVGLIEKDSFGYHWGTGVDSTKFDTDTQTLVRSNVNFHANDNQFNHESIPLLYGTFNDDSLAKIRIKYKDQNEGEATIIATTKGHIWYFFSDALLSPSNEPEVIRVYKDGTEKSGWYQ